MHIKTSSPLGLAALGLAVALSVGGCGSSQAGSAPVSPAVSASATTPSASASATDSTPSAPATLTPARRVDSWSGYHANQSRTGAVPAVASLDQITKAWSVDLGGAVRGQPLVADGKIIAATETNRVVALDPAQGKVLWSVSLGTPLTGVGQAAGCGNIDPLGITSTPVVDVRTKMVYVVGEVSDGGGSVHHQLEGLSVDTGAVRLSENADPPLPSGERKVHLLQRAGLALGNGRVYVSYGGNAGDCGSYHGWVVGLKESGPSDRVSFQAAPDGEGGAIWQSGGAPALDSAGNVYVTTGNANPDPPQGGPDPKKYTESVVKLDAELRPLASFKDTVAGGDEDLSTGNPVLLPGGRLFSVGKTDLGFVLDQRGLSRVATIDKICGSNPDGGPAYDQPSNRMFVPCQQGGIQVVNLSARKLGPLLQGADSAPIIVGRHVWAVEHNQGTLNSYDVDTGARQQSIPVADGLPIFTSPSAGSGLVLVGTGTGVTAFR